jgi:DNA gyrase inhibitor GyrI
MTYLLLPLIIIAGVLIYLATLPKDFHIRRSLTMRPDRRTVFAKVRDLRSWRDWSPWLLHEPEARLDYSPDPDQEGGWYTWDGMAIGAGRLTIVRLDEPSRIDQRLAVKRPFKSESDVWWELAETADGGTEVTWCMRGRLPFPLRFLTGLMTDMIEQDYQLGLALLRGTLDPSAERPRVRFQGATEHPSQTVLTIPYSGDLPGLIAAMTEGFPRLIGHLGAVGAAPAGSAFTAYHKVNAKARRFECEFAVPVPEGIDPGVFTLKRLGGGRYYATELQGSYDFLTPVWYSVMAHLRMHKVRQDRSRPSLEIYINDPSQVTDSNDYLTRILVPMT